MVLWESEGNMKKLPLSIWSGFFPEVNPEEMVDIFVREGFSCTEFSLEHANMLLRRGNDAEKIGAEFGRYAADKGFAVPQGHLSMDLELTERADLDELKKWIDLFHAIGIKNMVLHATGAYDEPYERQLELRGNAIRELAEHVEGTDVVICLENLFSKPMVQSADGILELIGASGGGEHLGICLDIGHLHRVRSHGLRPDNSQDFIRKAGKRLKALHIHDNMGVEDDHLFPFCKKGLDWKLFMSALEENAFDGIFNLELPGENQAPMELRLQKLQYAKKLVEYMMRDEFIHGC